MATTEKKDITLEEVKEAAIKRMDEQKKATKTKGFDSKISKKHFILTLTTSMLGTVAKNKDIFTTHVLNKMKKEAPEKYEEKLAMEQDSIPETNGKGLTGFYQDEHGIFISEHMVKGFLKSACEVAMATNAIDKVTAYKKWIDLLVFVSPRKLRFSTATPDGSFARPLPGLMTAQGPRTGLAQSDFVDVGNQIEFDVYILSNSKNIDWPTVEQLFDYGRFVGLGQWRGSGGHGRFVFECDDDETYCDELVIISDEPGRYASDMPVIAKV